MLSARLVYQFDLKDSLAGTMRAHNSMQAAKSLSNGFKDPEQQTEKSLEIEFALDNISLTAYIISQFPFLLTLTQYYVPLHWYPTSSMQESLSYFK